MSEEIEKLVEDVKEDEPVDMFSFTDEISSAHVQYEQAFHQLNLEAQQATRNFYDVVARYRGYEGVDDAHQKGVQFRIDRENQTVTVEKMEQKQDAPSN